MASLDNALYRATEWLAYRPRIAFALIGATFCIACWMDKVLP